MGASNPFFTDHARHYTVSERHARGADLTRLISLVGVAPGLSALDVATGTGHTALALAEAGCDVTGLDPTPAMLEEARTLSGARGLPIRWVQGVAEALPFADASWDIVTCRRAAHHFSDLPRAVHEMARVLRPGGRLGLVDMCPEADVAFAFNELERLRDPTHVAAPDDGAWATLLASTGLEVTDQELTVEEMAFAAWLAPVAPDGSEAAAARRALVAMPEPVRRRISPADGRLLKRRLILCARRRDG